MIDTNIVKLAVDTYKNVPTAFSQGNPNDVIRNAIIKANNGKTTVDFKDLRDGKCNGLFSLVEELITKTTIDGLAQNSVLYNTTEFKNGALGDKPIFKVNPHSILATSTVADGIQHVRRQ